MEMRVRSLVERALGAGMGTDLGKLQAHTKITTV